MKTLYLLLLVFIGLTCSPQLANSQQKNINCGCTPAEVQDWTLISAKGDGACVSDTVSIKLLFFKAKTVNGSEIRSQTKDIGLNACVLDHLFENQKLIPESWKTKHVAFPGTIYSDPGGSELFRFLKWFDDQWVIESIYINSLVYDDTFVAVKK